MIENAFENIRNACEKALQKKYTGGVPDRVRERLDEELGYLKESCFIEDFELQRRLFEEARKSSNLMLERAVVAGSFIYHLMGDTKVNPLPAHYYCPKCGHYEEAGRGIFGIDLPKEKCPECGETMISDGIDIPVMSVWDDKSWIYFESNVSSGFFPYARRLLEEMYPDNSIEIWGIQMQHGKNSGFVQGGFYILPEGKTIEDYPDLISYLDDGTKCMAASVIESDERHLKKVALIPNTYLDCAIYMQNKTGLYYDEISLDDLRSISYRDVCNTRLIDEKVRDLLEKNRPKSVKMINSLYAAANNSYGDMTEDERIDKFLQSEVFEKCPLYVREDVYDYLLEKGMDKDTAYSYMEMVRRGQLYRYRTDGGMMIRFRDVVNTKVPEELYESASICRYLLPRVHTAGYTYLFMALAYYMKKDSKAYSYFVKTVKE